MSNDDLWTAQGPTPADLQVLARLGRRRRTLEATTPADEEEAAVIARAGTLLDDMEECLCEEGRGAPLLAEGWQRLDDLEARLAELQASRSAEPADGARVVPMRRQPPAIPSTGGSHGRARGAPEPRKRSTAAPETRTHRRAPKPKEIQAC